MVFVQVPDQQKGDVSRKGTGTGDGLRINTLPGVPLSSVPPGVGRSKNDLPPAPLKPFGMTGHHPDPVVQRCRGHRKVEANMCSPDLREIYVNTTERAIPDGV